MASPFSALSAETAVELPGRGMTPPVNEGVLVAGTDPVLLDCAAFFARRPSRTAALLAPARMCCRAAAPVQAWPLETTAHATLAAWLHSHQVGAVVVFLGSGSPEFNHDLLHAVEETVRTTRPDILCLVSSFLVHLGDHQAAQAEAATLARLRPHVRRTALFRAGYLLSAHSRMTAGLRSWSFLHPLVPSHLASGFLDGDELFAAIEQEIHSPAARQRTFTLPGAHRSWRSVLREANPTGWRRAASYMAHGLSWLGLGRLAGLLVHGAARWWPALRGLNCATLYPTCARELLELYNKFSYQRVKIVGYNNGIVHFGHSYPGKTIVSTIRCHHTARVHDNIGTFDAGVTLRQAIDVVGRAGQEFYVLPNYSYVSLGTAFFVPIHGSASAYSTLGDTIDRVLLYDPVEDRFVSARRTQAAFGEYMYNQARPCLLLRLRLRLKEKTHYYRQQTRLTNPTGEELLALLQDRQVANVEIRKGKASSDAVDVYQYYTEPSGDTAALPIPRDNLGQLWDRLEANPLTSALFHGLTRRLAFHVEAFFSPEEFLIFWATHRTLPIVKIQLRYIRRDGLPHSPFRAHDCVSADLFMLRQHRATFESYVKEKFRAVQFNPGKHSA